ncbi:hypothetical protein H7849_18510 [Alloacidobacterium dinghuense]|uniref:LiaI-LiaF-like transmembrane region domain-containing protein n=1 Tax=Alloacidobacterium dinghuense TaxID=2763107 RepID=A0A7G8BEW0_9BACT|nr:DUF5668 domain-containing protein [Alloacidobacterium dinghuense]QNI31080.1 hypothetical protein H7849_18510 [Alloacidobacterium dinghuense]
MNQYIFLQRITGPAMLLTFGICALMDQWGVLNFGRSWPLYLIVLGVIKLAQRAALATAEPPQYQPGYAGYPPAAGPTPAPATGSTALVPTDTGITPTNDSGDRR